MAKSGKSKSVTYPNGKRRKDNQGRRLAPRAVRQNTDKHYMDQCDEAVVRRFSGIPFEEQTESSRW